MYAACYAVEASYHAGDRDHAFATARQLSGLVERLGEPPAFVALTLLGAKGYALYVPPELRTSAPVPIDRDALVIPAALVEDFLARRRLLA